MKYDDASWHSGGEFPSDSPDEYGGTHISLFLKWCFIKGWAGTLHLEEEPGDTKKVIDGSMSATEFFFKYCDGKFTDEDLNEEGNQFTAQYYGENGLYLQDYGDNFGDLMYLKPEEEHDFNKFSSMLESRLKSGILTTEEQENHKKKPWWKIFT